MQQQQRIKIGWANRPLGCHYIPFWIWKTVFPLLPATLQTDRLTIHLPHPPSGLAHTGKCCTCTDISSSLSLKVRGMPCFSQSPVLLVGWVKLSRFPPVGSPFFSFFFIFFLKKIIQGYFVSKRLKNWIVASGILASSTIWEWYWGNESWFVLKEAVVSQTIASHISGAGMQTVNEAGTSVKNTDDGEVEEPESLTRIIDFLLESARELQCDVR